MEDIRMHTTKQFIVNLLRHEIQNRIYFYTSNFLFCITHVVLVFLFLLNPRFNMLFRLLFVKIISQRSALGYDGIIGTGNVTRK